MALIIRGGTCYSPRLLGKRDILLAGGRIEAVAEPGDDRLRRIRNGR